MWKVLFAVFLVLVLVLLYSNDMDAQKSVESVKVQASAMVGSEPVPAATPVDASTTSAAAPVAEVSAEPKKEGFCPKLMQKYGFCDAGESMNNPARGSVWDRRMVRGASAIGAIGRGRESMHGQNIAKHTVWTGRMGSAVFPY